MQFFIHTGQSYGKRLFGKKPVKHHGSSQAVTLTAVEFIYMLITKGPVLLFEPSKFSI